MTGLENIIESWSSDNYLTNAQDRILASGLLPAIFALKSVCIVGVATASFDQPPFNATEYDETSNPIGGNESGSSPHQPPLYVGNDTLKEVDYDTNDPDSWVSIPISTEWNDTANPGAKPDMLLVMTSTEPLTKSSIEIKALNSPILGES